MMTIKSQDDLLQMYDGNKICGIFPVMKNSQIIFQGKNNLLFCESEVVLDDTTLKFLGDNSVIYLGTNRHDYRLFVSLRNDSVFHMGKHNYIHQNLTIILSEQRHCFIGDYGLFSYNIWIRNSDTHIVYDCRTRMRRNPTKSVYIGDHVWLGQESMILKGTEIDSGSIVGAKALVTGKKIPSNTSWGGNPARQIADEVFWDGAVVHEWTEEMTELGNFYDNYIAEYHKGYHVDGWIYNYEESESIAYGKIDRALNEAKSSQKKLEYLQSLNSKKTKNRFVHH